MSTCNFVLLSPYERWSYAGTIMHSVASSLDTSTFSFVLSLVVFLFSYICPICCRLVVSFCSVCLILLSTAYTVIGVGSLASGYHEEMEAFDFVSLLHSTMVPSLHTKYSSYYLVETDPARYLRNRRASGLGLGASIFFFSSSGFCWSHSVSLLLLLYIRSFL